MRSDEKKLFIMCYGLGRRYCSTGRECAGRLYYATPRAIITAFVNASMISSYKRAWYLLSKWAGKGFYDYGVTLDLGWFYVDKLPDVYKALLQEHHEGVNVL